MRSLYIFINPTSHYPLVNLPAVFLSHWHDFFINRYSMYTAGKYYCLVFICFISHINASSIVYIIHTKYNQVLQQDETPRLYSLVFGEGVVNDATSVVLFNAIQKLDVSTLDSKTALHTIGDFCYLFCTSTALGVAVSMTSVNCIVFGCLNALKFSGIH